MSAKFAAATKLTSAAATARLHAYQIAAHARRVKNAESVSFDVSYRYAQDIDPAAVLDYIPMGDREELTWWADMKEGGWRLNHPRRGEFKWVGEDAGMPMSKQARLRSKLFLCCGCVATDVRTVVVESRKEEAKKLGISWKGKDGLVADWDCISKWMEEAREEWKTLVPTAYAGSITDKDMDEVWELMTTRAMTKEQFQEWLGRRAWEHQEGG